MWVPVLETLTVDEIGVSATVLEPAQWIQQFSGVAFERAVIKRVVGVLTFNQLTSATAGNMLRWIWYIQDSDVPTAPNPEVVADLAETKILQMGARTIQATASGASAFLQYQDIDIKVPKAIDTSEILIITGKIGTDGAANPTVEMKFYGRVLVGRS